MEVEVGFSMNINKIELSKVDGISLMDGLTYCGSLKDFDKFLESFYNDIDYNASILEDSYSKGDISLFTIKVHALKTSARMIGAKELSSEALALEMAGKSYNTDYIDANLDELLTLLRSYKGKLENYISEKQRLKAEKKPISDDELDQAFDALREVCPSMDYGAVEMILDELNTYQIPKSHKSQIDKITNHFHRLEWDEIDKILMV